MGAVRCKNKQEAANNALLHRQFFFIKNVEHAGLAIISFSYGLRLLLSGSSLTSVSTVAGAAMGAALCKFNKRRKISEALSPMLWVLLAYIGIARRLFLFFS